MKGRWEDIRGRGADNDEADYFLDALATWLSQREAIVTFDAMGGVGIASPAFGVKAERVPLLEWRQRTLGRVEESGFEVLERAIEEFERREEGVMGTEAGVARETRVVMPSHMLTSRMKQATTLPEMAEAWVEDLKELQPAAEKLVDGLLELVHVEPMEGDNAVLEYDRGVMVARAIALLEPVRGSNALRVRFENETGYALDVHTAQEDGFLVLRLRPQQ